MTSPSAMTYDSLVTDISKYVERSDEPFLSQVPRFIMMAENRIASEVRGLGLLKVVTGTLTPNNPSFAKPERWRETSSLRIVNGTEQKHIYERSYEYCRVYSPDISVTGVPRFYSDYGYEHYLIAPTPDAAYEFELMYYERPEPLSSINQTTWTTRYAPQLILYASLLEAQPFLKTDERLQVFQGLYQNAAALVQAEAKRRVFDRATLVRE